MRAATGLKYYFVEQEQFEMEPIEELRLDAEYMRHLGFELFEGLAIRVGASFRLERWISSTRSGPSWNGTSS